MTLGEYAAEHGGLGVEWDAPANGDLTPDKVSAGSHLRAHWRCARGHTWEAQVRAVATGSGCPYCAGKLPIPGETDLSSTDPELVVEWDVEKNGDLTPHDVGRGSRKKVWWRCALGHSYDAVVFSRAAGTGCPYCDGKKVLVGFNDLASCAPDVAKQWYQPLNGGLTPERVTKRSAEKVWWQCGAGHVWRAAVYSRVGGIRPAGCPVCAGTTKQKRRYVSTLYLLPNAGAGGSAS